MVGNKINQKAAESYSKSFSSKIIEKHFASNQTITGQQILEVTPIRQVNFFVLKVLFLQWQDETKKFQSPFFDYSNPEVKEALKTLVNTLSKNILIKKEAFKPLLERAVMETITLMYSPQTFFIQEFSSLPNVTRVQGFKGLSKYIKLRKELYTKLVGKLESEGTQFITTDEIKALVQFVMNKEQMPADEVLESERAFAEILPLEVLDVEPEPVQEEPVATPEPEPEPVKKIEPEPEIEEKPEPVTPAAEDIVIETESDEEEEIGDIVIEEDNLEEIDQEDAEEDGGILIEKDEDESEHENMDDQFSPMSRSAQATVQSPQPTTVNEKFVEEKATLNQRFERKEPAASIAEAHESGKISEIQKNISVNQRYMFINDLFDNDPKAYNDALEEIENSNSFDDSVELLVQKYSKEYDWDMNSDEVKELLKVIFKRFR
jgi:hypothetical protein